LDETQRTIGLGCYPTVCDERPLRT